MVGHGVEENQLVMVNLYSNVQNAIGLLILLLNGSNHMQLYIDCGPPPSITNGSPGTPDMTTFGGTVTYSCTNGYEVAPGDTTTTVMCLATGTWGTPQTCTGI